MQLLMQPDGSTSCGQYCVAMITGKPIEKIVRIFGHSHCTSTKELIRALKPYWFRTTSTRLIRIKKETVLPPLAILKITWEAGGSHWVVLNDGMVYDPAYGTTDYTNHIEAINGKPTSYLEIRNVK